MFSRYAKKGSIHVNATTRKTEIVVMQNDQIIRLADAAEVRELIEALSEELKEVV